MYNRAKAVEYAKKWAFSFNEEYYNFTHLGGDCTNFVSQCLFAGGLKMDVRSDGWYYMSLSDRAPAWTGVEEFWNYGVKNNKTSGFILAECDKSEAEIGDVVQLFNGERYYHTVIITRVERSDGENRLFVAAHDNAAFDKPLYTYGAYSYRYAKLL